MKRITTLEWVNTLTHFLGFLLSIAGLVIMITYAVTYKDGQSVIGATIFGSSLIILYLASTLYHMFSHTSWKDILRQVDHMSIYVLIAGTYTFFCLSEIRGPLGWTIFAAIWGLALLGVIFKFIALKKETKLIEVMSLILYLLMGWLIMFAIKPVKEVINPMALNFLIYGGIAYTAGIIFYRWEKLPFNHGIWHLFVMAGSILHFFAVIHSF